MFFQGIDWKKIMPVDFRVIMPNPHYNRLKKPLVLPRSYEKSMMDETIQMLETWIANEKHEIKPWAITGKITDADINMLQVIDQIHQDGKKYQENKQVMKTAEHEIIENRKRMGF